MERDEALAVGLTRYSNGRPCLRGHISERNTKSGQCLECIRTGPRVARWGRSGDPEKAKVRAYEWRERNAEKLKFVQWANAANMRRGVGSVTYADLAAKLADQGGKCRYCGFDAEELDHVLPTRRGGTNWPWNLQFLCYSCNRRKAQRDPIEFEAEEGFYGPSWILLFSKKSEKRSLHSFACE